MLRFVVAGLSMFALLGVAGCSSFESHDDAPVAQEDLSPSEKIDLTVRASDLGLVEENVPADAAQPAGTSVEPPPAVNEEMIAPQQVAPAAAGRPVMRGYRVNRSVEVYPLDDLQ